MRAGRPGTGGRRGAAVAVAVVLSLATVLLAHAGLLLARLEYRAAGVGRRVAVAELAARQGAASAALDPAGGWTTGVAGDAAYAGLLRPLGPELWLAEGSGTVGEVRVTQGVAIWRLDPVVRTSALSSVVTVGVASEFGDAVDAEPYLETPDPIPPGGCPAFGADEGALPVPAARVDSLAASTGPFGPRTSEAMAADMALRVWGAGRPSPLSGPGGCVDAPWNWGAPGADEAACGGRMRGVAASPGTTVRDGVGQLLLVATGDLTLSGTLLFGGVVVAGRLRLEGGSMVTGFVYAAGGVEVAGDGRVVGSRCWAHAALSVAEVRRPVAVDAARWMSLGG